MVNLANGSELSRGLTVPGDELSIVRGEAEHRESVFSILKQGWLDVYTKINLGTYKDKDFASEQQVLDVFEDDEGNPDPRYFHDLEQALEEPSDRNHTQVALLGGRAVGFYQFSVEPANPGEYSMLRKLYVDRGARGKQIGGTLLGHAMEEHPELDLLVAKGNQDAVRFYRNAGFRQVGNKKTDYDFNGVNIPLLSMRHGSARTR